MFRFMLLLPDDEPNDPAVFLTPVPYWSVGECDHPRRRRTTANPRHRDGDHRRARRPWLQRRLHGRAGGPVGTGPRGVRPRGGPRPFYVWPPPEPGVMYPHLRRHSANVFPTR